MNLLKFISDVFTLCSCVMLVAVIAMCIANASAAITASVMLVATLSLSAGCFSEWIRVKIYERIEKKQIR